MQHLQYMGHFTCKELTTVNNQANTLVFLFTASRPNTQDSPSSGNSTTVALSIDL